VGFSSGSIVKFLYAVLYWENYPHFEFEQAALWTVARSSAQLADLGMLSLFQ
jgi:hypothetical protein